MQKEAAGNRCVQDVIQMEGRKLKFGTLGEGEGLAEKRKSLHNITGIIDIEYSDKRVRELMLRHDRAKEKI